MVVMLSGTGLFICSRSLLKKEYPILLKYHPKDELFGDSPQRIHLVDFPKFPYKRSLTALNSTT